MKKLTPSEIVRNLNVLKTSRKQVEQTWQHIELYVAPYRGKFFRTNDNEPSIEWPRRNIFDSTAVMAHQSLASSLHGALTNPAIRWFTMQWRDLALRNNHEAQKWLEEAARKVYDTLQDSNFNLEINETYRDLTSFGTSALIEEPTVDVIDGWEGVTFTSVPLKECYFEEDQLGGARTFYRCMEWTPSRILDKFGDDNTPDRIKKLAEKAADSREEVVYYVGPNPDYDPTNTSRVLPPEKRPYCWKYVCANDKTILQEGGYYEMPAFVTRWLTTSESRWGNSPATVALADILTLNQLVEMTLKEVEKAVDPVVLHNARAVTKSLDLNAGAQNSVRDINGITTFASSYRPERGDLKIMDLRAAVNRYFFVDQLELKESPAMTATEVQVRYELMQRLLAATLSRLRHDLLDPLLERTFRLLLRAGELGNLPEGVSQADLDIEYIGPLSRSQRFDQSASIERWLQQLGMIAQFSEEAAQQASLVPDWDAVSRMSGRNLNIPEELMRSKQDVQDDMESQQDRQQRAQDAEISNAESSAGLNDARISQIQQEQEGVPGNAAA